MYTDRTNAGYSATEYVMIYDCDNRIMIVLSICRIYIDLRTQLT